jgi:hypothetical protein
LTTRDTYVEVETSTVPTSHGGDIEYTYFTNAAGKTYTLVDRQTTSDGNPLTYSYVPTSSGTETITFETVGTETYVSIPTSNGGIYTETIETASDSSSHTTFSESPS